MNPGYRPDGPLACALAIGGIDPGGGAGVLADLRAFAATGAFGCAAVAVITVQSTAGLRSARPVPARELSEQILEVLAHERVRAIKVGALGSASNVQAVGQIVERFPAVPAVVDTPLRPTRGKGKLLADDAIEALRTALLPRAALITVNTEEAGMLVGHPVRTVDEAKDAARALEALGARAVLVKGGHLSGPDAIDLLAVGREVIELRARRIACGPLHGTGCTLASLIAGRIAVRGSIPLTSSALVRAVRWAKGRHHRALRRVADVGEGSGVLVFD
jgi:hydroxymethylpyrimidine/phosphomethylpyrimidine kinase